MTATVPGESFFPPPCSSWTAAAMAMASHQFIERRIHLGNLLFKGRIDLHERANGVPEVVCQDGGCVWEFRGWIQGWRARFHGVGAAQTAGSWRYTGTMGCADRGTMQGTPLFLT